MRELGRGGQGSVWLAEDVRIARKVALKVLASRFETVSEDRRRRFRREAEVIARLEHPSICPIYDADVDGDTPWIAMRLVEGKTLAQLLGEARAEREEDTHAAELRAAEAARHDSQESEVTTSWPPRSTLDVHRTLLLFERCARALHAAHEAGVIHRDVKPGNLIVTPDGKPVILDFGLARDETSDVGSITESGEVFGTPAYMSPEQLGGPSDALDRRTDVYSLGVALYEALTLKRPFDKGNNKAALYQAIQGEAAEDPRTLNDALSLDVKVVLETAMEKDRARRYRTALEFAEDLRRIREYEPIKARPASVPLKLARWIRKHPALASSLIGTIVVLAVGLTVALVLNVELQSALDVALGNHLAQRARALTREDPSAALVLGIEAVEKAPSDLTREALVETLEACRMKALIAPSLAGRKPGRMRDLAPSPSGGRVAIAFETGAIEVHDAQRFELERALAGTGAAAVALVWLPEERGLVAAYADGRIARWELGTGSVATERALDVAPTRLELSRGGGVLLVVGAPKGADAGKGKDAAKSDTRVVRVLDAETLAERARLDGLPEPIRDARLAPSGAEFVAWSPAGGVLSVRGTDDARERHRRDDVRLAAAFDVDTTAKELRVACGTSLGEVRVFEEDLVERATLVLGAPPGGSDGAASEPGTESVRDAGTESVTLLRIRGARVFASCVAQDGTPVGNRKTGARAFIVHWSSRSVRELELDASAGAVEAEFSPDGSELAFVDEDNRIHVVDVVSLAHERFVSGLTKAVQLAWGTFGHELYTRTNGPFAHVWFTHGAPGVPAPWPNSREDRPRTARAALLSPDGAWLFTAQEREGAVAWRRDVELFRLERELRTMRPPEGVSDGHGSGNLAFSPLPPGIAGADAATWLGSFDMDGSALWLVGASTLRVDLPPRDRASAYLLGPPCDVRAWTTSNDGRTFAALHENGDVVLGLPGAKEALLLADAADRPTAPLARELAGARAIGLALDARGERLALGLTDGRVLVVDPRSRTALRVLDEPKARGVVATCAFRPGTDELAVYGNDNRVRFWDVANGAKVRDDVVLFEPRSIAYSRDGKLLLTTGRTGGGAVRVFELEPFKPVFFKTHHTSSLTASEFSSDARFVLTASRDGTVFVRESTTGDLFARRTFEGREVLDAHFGGPSSALEIVAVTDDGAVHVWPVDPLPVARTRFVRELDGGEIDRERKLAEPLEYR